MTIDGISDLNTIAVDLVAESGAVTARASVVVRKSAFDVEATAKQLVPVDTHATQNSIFASEPGGAPLGPTSLNAEIGPTTDYAPFLEFGTSRMAPYAFMGPALDRHSADFETGMAAVVEGPILR